MKNKTTIILSIIAIIGGMVLNFQEFLMGSPATTKNFIVTASYITIWIIVLRKGVKSKNSGILIYCLVFWAITLFASLLTTYVNATAAIVDWAIPFAILFLGQFYGVTYFVESFLTTSIVISSISLIIFIVAMISLKGDSKGRFGVNP